VSDHAGDVVSSGAGSKSFGHAGTRRRAELVGGSSLLIGSDLSSRRVVGSGSRNLKFSQISMAGFHRVTSRKFSVHLIVRVVGSCSRDKLRLGDVLTD